MSAGRSVSLQILGRPYRVRSEGDADTIERAAALVDETAGKIRERTGTVDSLDVAVLAALNLANQYVALRDSRRGAREGGRVEPARVRELIDRIESVLGSEAAGST